MARRRSNSVALDIIPMVAALLVLPLALAPGLAPAILGLATLVVMGVAGLGVLALVGLVVVRLANGRAQRVALQTPSLKGVHLNVASGSVESVDVVPLSEVRERLRKIDWYQFEKVVDAEVIGAGSRTPRAGGVVE